ncbi:MAG: metal ABC transporter permease [Planctomycetaceae bacterium]|nr:metal ABC transporter permease [Planctomycetaceae bacterium]
MSLVFWTLAIALITAVTCALCGTYLVVKKEALVSEGISHAVLPGIIVGYLVFQDRSSPLLILSAAATGLLMVGLVQLIKRTRLVDGDASLGIVFSAMFSGGVILASQNLRNVHFHAQCIIDGNLATAALKTVQWGDVDLGPQAFWVMALTLALVLTFILAFYKELKLMAFDESLARSMGFRPVLMHLVWLGLVSITTVSAFEAAGSILVVALMIAPPAAAYLLTKNLFPMLTWSVVIAVASSVVGVYAGYHLDISPTGPIALAAGLFFLGVALFAPGQGIYSRWQLRRQQKSYVFEKLLLVQLAGKTDHAAAAETPRSPEALYRQVAWSRRQFEAALGRCLERKWILRQGQQYLITQDGRVHVEKDLY